MTNQPIGNELNENANTIDDNAPVTMEQFQQVGSVLNQVIESVNLLTADAQAKAKEEQEAFDKLSKSKQARILYKKELKVIKADEDKERRELELRYADKYKALDEKYEEAFIDGIEEDCALANQKFERIGKRVGATVAPVTRRIGGLFKGIKKVSF